MSFVRTPPRILRVMLRSPTDSLNGVVRDRKVCPSHAAVLITVDEGVVRHNLGALEIKLESHLTSAHRLKSLSNGLLVLPLAKEEQKPSSTRSSDLSTQGSALQCALVHLINSFIGYFRRKTLLDLP